MNNKDFDMIIEQQIQRSKDVLLNKQKEYATDTDRLHNFRIAAALQGCTPKQALGGFLAKHIVSIFDMCGSSKDFSDDQWNEKITDAINYLLLLRAVVEEEKNG